MERNDHIVNAGAGSDGPHLVADESEVASPALTRSTDDSAPASNEPRASSGSKRRSSGHSSPGGPGDARDDDVPPSPTCIPPATKTARLTPASEAMYTPSSSPRASRNEQAGTTENVFSVSIQADDLSAGGSDGTCTTVRADELPAGGSNSPGDVEAVAVDTEGANETTATAGAPPATSAELPIPGDEHLQGPDSCGTSTASKSPLSKASGISGPTQAETNAAAPPRRANAEGLIQGTGLGLPSGAQLPRNSAPAAIFAGAGGNVPAPGAKHGYGYSASACGGCANADCAQSKSGTRIQLPSVVQGSQFMPRAAAGNSAPRGPTSPRAAPASEMIATRPRRSSSRRSSEAQAPAPQTKTSFNDNADYNPKTSTKTPQFFLCAPPVEALCAFPGCGQVMPDVALLCHKGEQEHESVRVCWDHHKYADGLLRILEVEDGRKIYECPHPNCAGKSIPATAGQEPKLTQDHIFKAHDVLILCVYYKKFDAALDKWVEDPRGCQKSFRPGSPAFIQHVMNCGHQPMLCTVGKGCGKKIKKMYLEAKYPNKSAHVWRCKDCDAEHCQDKQDEHIEQCPEKSVTCLIKDQKGVPCEQTFKRSEEEAHKQKCTNVTVHCEWCNESMYRSEEPKHMQDSEHTKKFQRHLKKQAEAMEARLAATEAELAATKAQLAANTAAGLTPAAALAALKDEVAVLASFLENADFEKSAALEQQVAALAEKVDAVQKNMDKFEALVVSAATKSDVQKRIESTQEQRAKTDANISRILNVLLPELSARVTKLEQEKSENGGDTTNLSRAKKPPRSKKPAAAAPKEAAEEAGPSHLLQAE